LKGTQAAWFGLNFCRINKYFFSSNRRIVKTSRVFCFETLLCQEELCGSWDNEVVDVVVGDGE
jgi:hypothetical protein